MSDNLFTVENDVVLISGASRGIGEAIAAEFAGAEFAGHHHRRRRQNP